MKRLFLLALMAIALLSFACGGSDSLQEESSDALFLSDMASDDAGDGRMARFDEVVESEMAMSDAFEAEAMEPAVEASTDRFQDDQRDVISTASMSIEVDVVPEATASVRTIAVAHGGFIENLSTSGVGNRQSASMTVRVP